MRLKIKLRKYHKYTGFIFSGLLIYVSITGLILLYPEKLNLSNTFINNSIILKKYGFALPDDVRFFLSKENKDVLLIKNTLYYNKQYIDYSFNDVIDVFTLDDKIKIFEKNRIIQIEFILDDNVFIENQVNIKSNFININEVGYDKDGRLIFKNADDYYYHNSFLKLENRKIILIKKKPLLIEKSKILDYLNNHQGPGISLHLILTELHNGNFFGITLRILIILSTLALIFLTLSAFIFGIKRRKK